MPHNLYLSIDYIKGFPNRGESNLSEIFVELIDDRRSFDPDASSNSAEQKMPAKPVEVSSIKIPARELSVQLTEVTIEIPNTEKSNTEAVTPSDNQESIVEQLHDSENAESHPEDASH